MQQLVAAIQEFRNLHPEWSTQEGAYMECVNASVEFMHFLHEKGIEGARRYEFCVSTPHSVYDRTNPDPLIFKDGHNESKQSRAWGHCIVQLDDILIDWTARQYVETAPFPYIMPVPMSMSAKAGTA
jgi:hypothetical protein